MRIVDGVLVAFIEHEVYFRDFARESSMYGVSQDTGAKAVFLLAPGAKEADVSDDAIREFLAGMQS